MIFYLLVSMFYAGPVDLFFSLPFPSSIGDIVLVLGVFAYPIVHIVCGVIAVNFHFEK